MTLWNPPQVDGMWEGGMQASSVFLLPQRAMDRGVDGSEFSQVLDPHAAISYQDPAMVDFEVMAPPERYIHEGSPQGREEFSGLGLSMGSFEADDMGCAPVARVAPGCMLLPVSGVSPVTPGVKADTPQVQEGLSPRPGSVGVGTGAPACIHPQRWTEDQVRAWWDRRTRRRKDIGVPSRGTDGRNIMRWPIARFEQLCNGNTGMAAALYQDLRNEIERYENWKRVCMGLAEDSAPPLSSPRAESRRTRTAQSENTAPRTKARSPGFHMDTPHEAAASPSATAFGSWRADAPNANAAMSPGPSRRAVGVGGSFSAPIGSAQDEKVRRNSAGHLTGAAAAAATASSPSAPMMAQPRESRERDSAAPRSQAKAQTLKFAPAARHAEVSPAIQRRSATAVDPARGGPQKAAPTNSAARIGTPLNTVPEPAGRKSRVKSAPRPSRKPATGDSNRATFAKTATEGSAPNAGSQRQGSGPNGGERSNAPAKSRTVQPSASEKKKPRALVMEDLQDETLAQVGTPKKNLSGPDVLGQTKAVRTVSARDDSEIARRQRATSTNADEEEDGATRRMFDKRLLRRRHRDVFDQQLAQWRAQHLQSERSSGRTEAAPSRVRVCVRKRPLFDNERQADEFDVITVREGNEIVVHNCLTKADLRSLFVSHMGFQFSHAFGQSCTDDEVYTQCAAPAVDHVLREGVATIFMFGQTGSGKTHTMGGLIERAMAHLNAGGAWSTSADAHCPSITAFEIAGRRLRDLLDTPGTEKELKVMEDKGHRTRVLGLCHWEAGSADELLRFLYEAQRRRTTRATQVNDTSSRSHAVYRVSLGAPDGATSLLTLVDCAGSERREDTSNHDAQSRKDAAEINSTIFALKECFRVMRSSKGQQPPFRESLLTRVLADSFSSEHALIVAIGTVSPSASDTEHSIGTLRALQQLQGTQMSFEDREDVAKPRTQKMPHPQHWSEEEVRVWLEGAIGGRARAHASGLSRGTDGKNLVRWPLVRFTQLCAGDDDLGSRLYQDLRQKIRSS